MISRVDEACAVVVNAQSSVSWAALVDEEGELVGYWPPEHRAEAAVAAAVLRVAFAPEFAKTRARVALETESGTWHAYPMSEDYLFVLRTEAGVEPLVEPTFAAILMETQLSPNTWSPPKK